jgi:hypothetical protein
MQGACASLTVRFRTLKPLAFYEYCRFDTSAFFSGIKRGPTSVIFLQTRIQYYLVSGSYLYTNVPNSIGTAVYTRVPVVCDSHILRGGACAFENLGTIQGIPSELQYYYHLSCSTTCITSAPWTRKMPSRSPCPKAAEARGREPAAAGHGDCGAILLFGGRCCLTAGATTDHSQDASRLRHPGTGTSTKVQ